MLEWMQGQGQTRLNNLHGPKDRDRHYSIIYRNPCRLLVRTHASAGFGFLTKDKTCFGAGGAIA